MPCPDGRWCDGNTSVPCPAGRYGAPGTQTESTSSTPGYAHVASSLLGTDSCTGPCAPGHYCPPGSTSPTQVRCPAGTFGGPEGGLGSAACSGLCHPGYYCPGDGKSTNATRFACAEVSPGTHLDWDEDGAIDDGLPRIALSGDGEVSSVFCPEGSGRPIPVSDGFYTLGGGAFDSKIVSYKSYDRETWPSGESVGNLADHVHSAGDHDHGQHRQRRRDMDSSKRQRRDLSASSSVVDSAAHTGTDHVPGRTTAPPSPASSHLLSASTFLNGYTRSSQKLCEPGTYCREGVRRLCPPGQFGVESGLTINTCSGRCAPGFFCTAGRCVFLGFHDIPVSSSSSSSFFEDLLYFFFLFLHSTHAR